MESAMEKFLDSPYVLVAVMAVMAILTMIHSMRRGTPGQVDRTPDAPDPNCLPWPVMLGLILGAMMPIGLVALLLHVTGRL
jgi:Na+/H+ antiporter NhaD/arsenite permease-like protein